MCLQCKVKSNLKIFNNVGGKKPFIMVSEWDGFISETVLWYLSNFHTLSGEIIIPPSGAFFWWKHCFTLARRQRRGWPQGGCPRGGLFPQGAIATGVILVAVDESGPHLPPWCQVLSGQTAPGHPPRQGGQHVFHAVTGVLIAKLVLEGKGGES